MKHNWEYKSLGSACIPKRDILRASLKFGKEDVIEYFDISSINKDSGTANSTTYTFGDAPSRAQQVINDNDVLVSLVRPNLKNIALVQDDRQNLVGSSGFCILRGRTLTQRYIYYLVSSDSFTNKLVLKCAGAAYPAVKEQDVKDILVPVPSIETQNQIVAELDKITEVIADCRRLLCNLDSLAQSLFFDYFSGIHEYVPLSHYVNALVGGKSLASKEVCENRVLKSGAVTYDYFDKHSTKYLPNDYNPNSEHSVKIGDLIISRMNTAELVGACAYVFDVDDNVYLPDRLWRIEHKSNSNPIFLWKSLIDESAKEQIRAKASGTSGSMKNISKPLLLSVKIKQVPLSLQNSFADRIEAIERQKATVEETIKKMQTLLDSRMDYWFN